MSGLSNIVYVGRNPPMSYVLAVLTGFSSGNGEEVILKARGRAITTAVDVAEITRRRFMKGMKISDIALGTEELPQEMGGTRAVSTIEITLKRSSTEKTEQGEDEAKEGEAKEGEAKEGEAKEGEAKEGEAKEEEAKEEE